MGEISKAKESVTDKDLPSFEDMMQLDEVSLERVKELKKAKDRAIKMEDYDAAKKYKQMIERLKSMGTHLAQLEERKKIAIENEDFDAAKIIKTEIDRLRATAVDPAFNHGPYSDQPKPSEAKRPFSGGPDAPMAEQMPPPRKPKGMGMGIEEGMDKMAINDPPPRKGPALPLNNKKDLFGPGPGKPPGKGLSFPASDKFHEEEKKMAMPIEPQIPQNIDDQVIPAARAKAAPNEGGIIPGEEKQQTEAEDIVGDNVRIAQPLIPTFGESTIKKLFSNNWANRENAIIEALDIFNSNPDPDAVTAALGVAAQGIKDKIGQVVLKTCDLINNILAAYQEPAPSDAKFYIEEIVSNIANRVGDNNGRIREKAFEIGVEMAAHPMAGHSMMITQITRAPAGKRSAAQSVRQQAGKYKLLYEVLVNTPVTKPTEQRSVATFSVAGFKNSNKEIRENAYNCIIELYRVMGSSMKKFLDDLRPAQVELLEKGFNEVDGIDPDQDFGEAAPKVTVETNITPFGAKEAKSKAHDAPGDGDLDMLGESPSKFESSFKADNDNMCQFCGKYELGWNQEELDMHFWSDCAMLTPCFGCNQILEISGLNEHLLTECNNKDSFQQCPKCQEPIPIDDYDYHVEEGLCNPAQDPNEANRCPLCHDDIYPAGEDGWKQHLLIDTCPNNERHP